MYTYTAAKAKPGRPARAVSTKHLRDAEGAVVLKQEEAVLKDTYGL